MYHGLFQRIDAGGRRAALHTDDGSWTYAQVREAMAAWGRRLVSAGVRPCDVVAIRADYSLASVSLFLALLEGGQVVAALPAREPGGDGLLEAAGARFRVDFEAPGSSPDGPDIERLALGGPRTALIERLAERGHGGLIVFSSGTTGQSKAVLFDFEVLSRRYAEPGRPARTLAFLFLDHLGGINTVLHTLSAAGTVVATRGRSPLAVCRCVQERGVEVLPATPTFLRMLMVSRLHERFDLSSLKLITYGTEPMAEITLERLRETFPRVRFKQTYGLSELGVLPTRSPASGSLWLELGGLGCETRIRDGVLQIRSETAMMGYLNAPDPFDEEGWYDTQDLVESDGRYLRVLGRSSEVVNVGGEKVHPVEVENVLLEMAGVVEATVWGKTSPVTGQIVAARLTLERPEPQLALERRLHAHCRERLAPFKIPAHVELGEGPHAGVRLKKVRRDTAPGTSHAARVESEGV